MVCIQYNAFNIINLKIITRRLHDNKLFLFATQLPVQRMTTRSTRSTFCEEQECERTNKARTKKNWEKKTQKKIENFSVINFNL